MLRELSPLQVPVVRLVWPSEMSALRVPVMTQVPGLVHSPLLVHSFVVWFEQVPSERKPRMRWLPLSTTNTRSGVLVALRAIATPCGWKVRLATIWLTTVSPSVGCPNTFCAVMLPLLPALPPAPPLPPLPALPPLPVLVEQAPLSQVTNVTTGR